LNWEQFFKNRIADWVTRFQCWPPQLSRNNMGLLRYNQPVFIKAYLMLRSLV